MAVEAGLSVYVVGGQGVRLFVVVVSCGVLDAFFFLDGACWTWSATHLGEDNSDNEPTGRIGLSALVGNSPMRRKVGHQTYRERIFLALPNLQGNGS